MNTKEAVKERLGITDVVGSYIKLQKAGVNFKARCPFHQEKTPSFFVSPSRGGFYCFGCGAKGDIFSFVERFEGVDFLGALKILAERAGVAITYESRQSKDEREKLFALIEEATRFFEEELNKEKAPRQYLLSRGVSEDTVKIFRLGYAPAKWRTLSAHLEENGFPPALIEKAGLSKPGNRGEYDRFRGRIMFPIFDASGRPVAFSGRIFDASVEGEGVTPAKYVNSPETPLYQKSKILYGFHRAKEGIRKWTFAIVVEGQMDLIMSHQAGFSNTVALSGTALTAEQLVILSRLSDRILLSLDADAAGLSAAGKSASLALSEGFDVKVAHLESGKDPAEVIKNNSELWKKIIRGAKHVVEFYLDVLKERNDDWRRFRLEVTKTVLPYVKKIKSAVDRAHFTNLVAERLSVPVRAIEEELRALPAEEEVRAAMEVEGKRPTILSRQDIILKHLLGLAKSAPDKINEEDLKKQIAKFIPEEQVDKIFADEAFSNEAAFAVEMIEKNGEPPEVSIRELLIHLELESYKADREKISEDIKERERQKDEEGMKKSMGAYQKISKKITELENRVKQNNFSKDQI